MSKIYQHSYAEDNQNGSYGHEVSHKLHIESSRYE